MFIFFPMILFSLFSLWIDLPEKRKKIAISCKDQKSDYKIISKDCFSYETFLTC